MDHAEEQDDAAFAGALRKSWPHDEWALALSDLLMEAESDELERRKDWRHRAEAALKRTQRIPDFPAPNPALHKLLGEARRRVKRRLEAWWSQ